VHGPVGGELCEPVADLGERDVRGAGDMATGVLVRFAYVEDRGTAEGGELVDGDLVPERTGVELGLTAINARIGRIDCRCRMEEWNPRSEERSRSMRSSSPT
jgi:hypothetical protein